MKSKEYWAKRAENITKLQEKKADIVVEEIEKQYQKTLNSIQRDIESFYLKYADAEGITYSAAKRLLTEAEKKTWEISLEEYRRMALSGGFEKELDAMYSRSRISRFQALNTQIQAGVEALHQSISDKTTKLLENTLTDTYYRNIYEIQKGTNLGINFATYNQNSLNTVLSKPWKYGDFSSHIWDDKEKLLNELETNLTQSFIRGDSAQKTIKTFSERMRVDKYRTARIVQTESAYMAGEATADAYKSQGIIEYEFLATLDLKTSELCRGMDSKVFKISEKEAGVNYPPLHAFCRSTTIPYFDDDDSKRIARSPSGKSYYVDSNINYEQWYKDNVKNNPEALIAEKKMKNRHKDKDQYERYKKVLGKDIPAKSFDKFQDLKYNNIESWTLLKGDYRKLNAYNKIIANEPAITKDLKDIAQATKTEMVGLEYRLKSKASYLRKVNADSNNSVDPKMIDETIFGTNDVIRYTYQAPGTVLVHKYHELNKMLSEKGYKLAKMKNTWTAKNNPYKGINCNYISPDGQSFEVQYHTPGSFKLKNGELHQLYEKWRLIKNKASSEAIELSKKMGTLSSSLKAPDKITELR